MNNKIDQIYKNNKNFIKFSNSYIEYLTTALNSIDFEQLDLLRKILLKARSNNNSIYFAGNGGSGSTSSHFVNDLSADILKSNGKHKFTKSFRTFSLNDNIPSILAISNDINFNEIFSRQISVLGKKNDVLVVISASGNSKNLIKAVKIAKKLKIKTVGLLGFDGGILKKIVDVAVMVHTNKNEFGPTEDAHLVICHILTNFFSRLFKK